MATFKQSVDFLPKLTKEEKKEQFNVSKAGLYASILPLLASLIWIIAVFGGVYFKEEVAKVDAMVVEKEREISTYSSARNKHTELVLKVDALKDLIQKDFYPQKFFTDVSQTIKSTGDAQAEIYAYGREAGSEFIIKGKANSYLDLAKIMVVFTQKEEFDNVVIESIRYNQETDNVNFEVSFNYAEEQET